MATYGGGNAGGYAPRPQVRLDAINEAWRLFQQQAGTWILAMLIGAAVLVGVYFVAFAVLGAMLFSTAAVGDRAAMILAPAQMILFFVMMFAISAAALIIMGGMYRMAIKQMRGETISIGDMFSVTDVLLQLFIAALLVSLITSVANGFCYVPGLIAGGTLMLAIPLVVDQRMGALQAISQSWNLLKNDIVMATVFYFLLMLLQLLGAIPCGLGLLVTFPLWPLSIAVIYRDFVLAPSAGPMGFAAMPTAYPPTGAPNIPPPTVYPPNITPVPPTVAPEPLTAAPPPFAAPPAAPPIDLSAPVAPPVVETAAPLSDALPLQASVPPMEATLPPAEPTPSPAVPEAVGPVYPVVDASGEVTEKTADEIRSMLPAEMQSSTPTEAPSDPKPEPPPTPPTV